MTLDQVYGILRGAKFNIWGASVTMLQLLITVTTLCITLSGNILISSILPIFKLLNSRKIGIQQVKMKTRKVHLHCFAQVGDNNQANRPFVLKIC